MNKQLQHIATALLLLVLLGAGKAWGQKYAFQSGSFTDNNIWSTNPGGPANTTAPTQWDAVVIPDGITVTVSGDLTASAHSGNLTINGNLIVSGTMSRTGGSPFIIGATGTLTTTGSLDIANLEVQAGGVVRIGGSYNHTSFLTLNGLMVVESDMNSANGTQMTIGSATNSNAILVVKGNAVDNSIYNIWGKVFISGNLNKNSGGTLTLETTGYIAVGGNYNIQGTTTSVGGRMTVLGSFTSNNQVQVDNSTTTGFLTVLGSYSVPNWPENTCPLCSVITPTCCPDPDMSGVLLPDDPIFTTIEGVQALYWEDFIGKAGTRSSTEAKAEWTMPATSPASITSTEILTATFGSTKISTSLWESGEIITGCYSNVTVSAYLTGSGSPKAFLQFSTYNPLTDTWSAYSLSSSIEVSNATTGFLKNATPITASRIKLRLWVQDMDNATVNLDNIEVHGTRGYGAELPALNLEPGFDQLAVCEDEIATYRLSVDYYNVVWNVTGHKSVSYFTQNDFSYMRVTWGDGTIARSISATASNECGRVLSKTWTVTGTTGFKVSLISKTDLNCANTAIGAIEVRGFCGSGSYAYNWVASTGGIIPAGQGSGPTLTGLTKGTYTVTATDNNTSQTAQLSVVIDSPDAVNITLLGTSVTNSCDPSFGCDGILDFEISGGVAPLTTKLDGVSVPYVSRSVVRLEFTSLLPLTGYQYKVVINRSEFPNALAPDFSDIRFFSDSEQQNPLYYWLDPSQSTFGATGTATFYVKIPSIIGGGVTNMIYMIYGDHSLPSFNSITNVMDQGSLFVEYFTNTSWAGIPSATCWDTSTKIDYAAGANIGGCAPLTTANALSIRWSGWYTIPDAGSSTYLKIDAANNNQILFTTSDNAFTAANNGNASLRRYDLTSYELKTVYIEIMLSKTAGIAGGIMAGFSGNSGTFQTNNIDWLVPRNGFSRQRVYPEPSDPLFVKSARFTDLCAGTYLLTVTDARGCTSSETFTIDADSDVPQWATFPIDYSDLLANAVEVPGQTLLYEPFANVKAVNNGWTLSNATLFADQNRDLRFNGNGNASVRKGVNTFGFKNITIELTAYQSPDNDGNGWNSTDYLQVQWTQDITAGTPTWNTLIQDYEVWQGTTTGAASIENYNFPGDGNAASAKYISATLPVQANNNPNFGVRIVMNSDETDEQYFLSLLQVKGTIEKSVALATTGTPTVNEGGVLSTTIVPTYLDQVTVGCSGGNRILRTWTATDDCGNSISRVQTISLAARLPEFTGTVFVPNTRYGFCHRTVTFTIPQGAGPASNPTCTPWTLGYTLDGGTTRIPVSTNVTNITGNTFDLTFAIGSNNNFRWYITDGINATAYYTVATIAIDPIITATFDYSPSQDFCSGNSVTVTVTPSGGSGNFASYTFESTIPTTITGTDGSGATGVWTTNGFKNGDQVQVTITDTATPTGCSETIVDTGSSFTIHDEITTNPIQPAP